MTRLIQYFLAFLCISALTACGGGGGSPGKTPYSGALFTTAGTSLQLLPGESKTFTIGGGTPSYSVTTTSGAVSATVSGTVLTVTGSSGGGTGSVVVTDSAGAQVTFSVTVATGITLFTSASSSVTVIAGSSNYPIYRIGGGSAVYSVSSSNPAYANAGLISANTFAIIGVSPTATNSPVTVTVTDTLGGVVSINVTVLPGSSTLYSTAPSAINLPTTQTVTYSITGGTPSYTAVTDSLGVATAAIINGSTLSITGLTAGTANVTVSDQNGAKLTTVVTVTAPNVGKLAILPAGATGNVGDVLTFNVTGGFSPYTVSNSNNTIATVTAATGGASFTATLNNIGTTLMNVIDAQGNSQTITVTVALNPPTLRLSPNAFEISEQSNNAITLNIYGGTGPYVGFTSDPKMGGVTVVNNSTNTGTFTVGAVNAGVRCFTPTTPLSTYPVTLTVIDSKGAAATSVMSIRDTLSCP